MATAERVQQILDCAVCVKQQDDEPVFDVPLLGENLQENCDEAEI